MHLRQMIRTTAEASVTLLAVINLIIKVIRPCNFSVTVLAIATFVLYHSDLNTYHISLESPKFL